MEWIKKYKWAAAGAAFCICAGLYIFAELNKKEDHEVLPKEVSAEAIEKPQEETPPEQPQSIVIDVKGAVKKPGVYDMQSGDRVHHVIQKAGGILDGADQNQLNLALLLQDGMVIYVPKKGEEGAASGAAPEGQSNVESTEQNGSAKTVNINTATSEELQTLPGIGPSRAETIIAYREENGGFKTIEDMMNVSGIGEKSFEKLKPSITVK
ncbi:helix-hairpin-helix domain-containing protein [Bacillus gobiensis]|uniref:helix-hairpin-helix domain-containing protein n=1 Tax=Bacillus gobiensis TaxID=1441095 RepID=UPI003D1D6F8F